MSHALGFDEVSIQDNIHVMHLSFDTGSKDSMCSFQNISLYTCTTNAYASYLIPRKQKWARITVLEYFLISSRVACKFGE